MGDNMRTRHWASIGLAAMGIAAIWKGQIELATSISVAIGGMFLWDKIQNTVKGGKK